MQRTRKRKDNQEDSIERLQGRIKELESTNKTLRKRLKRLEKYSEQFIETVEAAVEESHEETQPQKSISRCPECVKGTMAIIKITDRQFERCQECGFRTKARKVTSGKNQKT